MMDARSLIAATTRAWLDDPESAVVWAGEHEGRLGVRMTQQVRDFTTVWFATGERTVRVEAYVLPVPAKGRDEVYRQCLVRNLGTRLVRFAIGASGEILLTAVVPSSQVSEEELELVLGEIYELIEVSFRSLVSAGFAREISS